jgi:hypothetical protein
MLTKERLGPAAARKPSGAILVESLEPCTAVPAEVPGAANYFCAEVSGDDNRRVGEVPSQWLPDRMMDRGEQKT